MHAPDTEADKASGEVAEDRQAEDESQHHGQPEGLRSAQSARDEPPLDQILKSLDDSRGPFAPPLHHRQIHSSCLSKLAWRIK